VDDLKRQGMIRAMGISVDRWEPANVLETLKTGLIDSVQVIYTIFDQAPEDELFPLCRQRNIAAPDPSRNDHARVGPAVDFGRAIRLDDHPRNEEVEARPCQPGRQRWEMT